MVKPALRAPLLLIVYGAVFALLAGTYFVHYPWPGFAARLGEGARAVGLLLAAAAVGRQIFSAARFPAGTGPAEGFVWAVAMGLVPLPLLLLGAGVMGFYSPEAVRLIGVLWALGGAFQWTGLVRDFRRIEWPRGGVGALAWFVLGLGLLCAWAPPTYYDSLVYHLALPLRYLQEGRVGFVPFNHYSHFPQNMEMIFGWFLALGSDVAAHVFVLGSAALTGLLLWSVGAREGRRWDLVLFLTAPCVLLLSTETYVEAPLALFSFLTVLAVERGHRRGERRWFVWAGVVAGFAAGIKYTAILTPLVLTPMILLTPRVRARERFARWALFGGAAFLVFLPWLVKNYFYTGGNPVFPFLPSVFPAKNVFLAEASARSYFQVLDEYKGSSSLLWDLFRLPLRLVSNATAFGGGFDVTGDLGWALPLLLLPLGGLAKGPGRRFLWIYLLLHIVLWASFRPVLRFLFPVFPLVCLLAGEGAAAVLDRLPVWGRRAALALGGVFLVLNGVHFYWVERVRDPFPVALGLQTRDQYLKAKLDYYPAMAFMGDHLPPEARVLFLGDQRAYYCPRRHLAPMALLPAPMRAWAEDCADGAALEDKLKSMGFTHVYFHEREAERLKSYGVLDLTENGRRVFTDFLRRSRPVYRSEDQAVLALGVP
jgi:hypothetical protein